MPIYKVRRRVDAYVDYVAEVEAKNAKEASALANEGESEYAWKEEGPCEFDDRLFITLDESGCEIDGTQVGDF